jgi:hypothetical protein
MSRCARHDRDSTRSGGRLAARTISRPYAPLSFRAQRESLPPIVRRVLSRADTPLCPFERSEKAYHPSCGACAAQHRRCLAALDMTGTRQGAEDGLPHAPSHSPMPLCLFERSEKAYHPSCGACAAQHRRCLAALDMTGTRQGAEDGLPHAPSHSPMPLCLFERSEKAYHPSCGACAAQHRRCLAALDMTGTRQGAEDGLPHAPSHGPMPLCLFERSETSSNPVRSVRYEVAIGYRSDVAEPNGYGHPWVCNVPYKEC